MNQISFHRCRERRELVEPALELVSAGQRIALATLVNIEGSAPYPIGSQMLISEIGQFFGQITGGCAEKAIADLAVLAIKRNESVTHRYGLNSPFFDIQLPCGSGIDVFIDVTQPVEELARIVSVIKQGETYTSVLQSAVGEFSKIYYPTPKLLIVGQGPILTRLGSLAVQAGFDTLMIAPGGAVDQRPASHSDSVGLGSFAVQSLETVAPIASMIDAFTGVVSLFHEHEYEYQILGEALSTNAFYVGALGSRRTHEARKSALLELGVETNAIDRIFGPVGLDIRAQSPSQIAVSILAQVIDELNKFSHQ